MKPSHLTRPDLLITHSIKLFVNKVNSNNEIFEEVEEENPWTVNYLGEDYECDVDPGEYEMFLTQGNYDYSITY
ncbi:hypothetical protein P5663_06855 [Priestia flexa]|uniref:hypothetical protein n=1 Tax=Priestia flexa TaxID=86664 RepID=UPI00240D0512|nr:hypothetical protein [Priestia flexa]WEZ09558.1 hypothetical protein P5663_06855 [Priestia flexa]